MAEGTDKGAAGGEGPSRPARRRTTKPALKQDPQTLVESTDDGLDDGITRRTPDRRSLDLKAPTRVELSRTASPWTDDAYLWEAIKDRTQAISYESFSRFMDAVMDKQGIQGVGAYQALRAATQVFMRHEAGLVLDNPAALAHADAVSSKLVEVEGSRLPGEGINDSVYEGVAPELRDALQQVLSSPDWPRDRQNEENLHEYYLSTLTTGLKGLPYHKVILDRLRDLRPSVNDTIAGLATAEGHLRRPVMVELIWSYWHEEGMLAQTFNALLGRFQNVSTGPDDPLARLDLDPLRSVNNLLWGWIQDEQNRLTVKRRAYEYKHQYGISLHGKAVGSIQPADSRSRFIRAFHDLLATCQTYFEADDDTTVVADAFPVLNALTDVHVLLAEGAHNQYGDLPWTARMEMLMSQWILARPELREFLGGRTMVPYREPWMDRVDAMKQVQGWTSTSVSHFRDLGFFGERILLSTRFGNWNVINDQTYAANWARYWRPEIQSYMHAYRAATGVDLTGRVVEDAGQRDDGRYAAPSEHLRRELERQRRKALPSGQRQVAGPRVSSRRALPAGQ